MTSQTQYWNRLIQPGIVALVGAGGKTTVLSKLVEYGRLQGQAIVVTTTTQLYESQVAQYEPGSNGTISVSDSTTVIDSIGQPRASQAICVRIVLAPIPISEEPVYNV